MKTFSKLTYFYGLFIIISASFMQQVQAFIVNKIGENNFKNLFYLICIIGTIFLFFYCIKKHVSLMQFVLLLVVICFAALLMYYQRFFAEKTHVITYGLLGYLAMNDTSKIFSGIPKQIILAFCFALMISALDEAFQAILPYRVGELLDIFTNFLSSLLGIVLFTVLRKKVK